MSRKTALKGSPERAKKWYIAYYQAIIDFYKMSVFLEESKKTA